MRFGWLAAAAAMVFAVPASAARYYEFQVSGVTVASVGNPNGGAPIRQTIASTVTATFDTIDPSMPFYAQGAGFATVFAPFPQRIYTLNQPGGTYFDLTFNLASVANSLTLSNIAATGTFGFLTCPSGFCTANPGGILSVSARTSDVAPAFLGSIQTFGAIAAVPEPTTWMMMLAGLGMLGSAMRRRGGNRAAHPGAMRSAI